MLAHRFKVSKLYSFIDMLLILLFVSLALINPPEDHGKIVPRADGMLTVEWDADMDVDVDTWVRLANRDVIAFTNKDVALGILRRDDLGKDYYNQGDKPKVEVKQNLEIVDFMKLVDGTYVVNLHYYNPKSNPTPVEVVLNLYIMEPYHRVLTTTLTLSYRGEEQTAFTFTIKDGVVDEVNMKAKVTLAPRSKSR